jgi:hypothetical protein
LLSHRHLPSVPNSASEQASSAFHRQKGFGCLSAAAAGTNHRFPLLGFNVAVHFTEEYSFPKKY